MPEVLLPEPGQRWTPSRKLMVLRAVEDKTLTLNDALVRYNITIEEYLEWDIAYEEHGALGLRVKDPELRRQLAKETELRKIRIANGGRI